MTTEGNKDPWSIVTKIARDKLKVAETTCSLNLPTGEITLGWRDIFDTLIKKAVPTDDLGDKGPETLKSEQKIISILIVMLKGTYRKQK